MVNNLLKFPGEFEYIFDPHEDPPQRRLEFPFWAMGKIFWEMVLLVILQHIGLRAVSEVISLPCLRVRDKLVDLLFVEVYPQNFLGILKVC